MSEAATVGHTNAPRPDRAGWVLRVVLALLFVVFGLQKFPVGTMWVRLFDRIGWGQWFRYTTGVVEVCAGVLFLVPPATLVAVALAACTMFGAVLVHVFVVGVGPQTVVVSVLLIAALGVGWRWDRRRLQR